MPASPDTTDCPATGSYAHPLDAYVADPTGLRPLCDEPRFAAILEGMVADAAPRIFAIVEEYGERVDASIAAWGISFGDHAEVVGGEHNIRMSLQQPERALPAFNFGTHIRARIVWFNAEAATPDEDEEDEPAASL